MASDWIMLILSKVFTKIKAEFPETVKTKYDMTNANFSTVGSSDTPAVFPFVYVQLLPGIEQGRDLDGADVNGGLFTFQIDVTDNKTQSNARKIMTETMLIMKKMGFDLVSMPSFVGTNDNTHRMTARFRKAIGAHDNF